GHSAEELEVNVSGTITTLQQAINSGSLGGGSSSPDYDSGWFAVISNTEYSKTHNFGTKDYFSVILFRENADSDYYNPVYFEQPYKATWDGGSTGAVILEQANDSIKIRTGTFYVTGIGQTDLNSKYYKTSGQYRILLWKF
ncbi:MAG: hypothetical protein KKB21_04770, partial [Nanoarchaeota archaeon]|nr:hypothetical protein [Nanoarchaeota archaeon]